MSPRKSKPVARGGDAGKPAPDVFTGLLFVAVAALIAGCVFLTLELNKYDWAMPQ